MLTTRFNLCQVLSLVCRREISELAAGSQDVAAATFSDEHVDASLPYDRLEDLDIMVGRTPKCTARKRIEGDQVDFARDTADQLNKTSRIVFLIVDTGQDHILEG